VIVSVRKKKKRSRDYCDVGCVPDCDVPGCDCDIPGCDCFSLSTMVRLSAALTRTSGRSGPGGRVSASAQHAVTTAIRGYRVISPRLPTRCRYQPTCSAYALLAIERHGLGAGLRLTAARLARCRPGVPFGTGDPVP
jgi:putative membrane protein insertion efficiency factor